MNTSPSRRLLAAALTLLLAPALHAGKPQQLTSPDQVPEGLGKSDWSSIRAAHEGWKHQIRPVEGGWQAVNSGQQWTTRFDGRGFVATPKDADWTWGLEFQSYGFGDRQTRVSGTPEVRTEGQRISYQWSDTVEEWFVNDGRGLEHGFTLAERPAGSRENEALALTLATRGPLKPSLSADRQTVHFRDSATAPVLNYSGLKVWDADGTVLPSRFQVVGSEVRLLVEESTARYPITIDPIAQQAYLKASNNGPPSSDVFGKSVAVSGDTVVVGATGEASSTTGVNSTPNESASSSGAAYVFTRVGSTWSQQAYLKASNTGASDQFGYSVAVSGNTVVVGATGEDSSTTGVNSTPDESAGQSGAAFIFTGLGPLPMVADVSPASGGRAGGTSVVITGTNFNNATEVFFGGIPAAGFTVNSATSITATTAAHPPGIVDVEVTTPIGTATGSGLFTFLGQEIAVEQPSGNDLMSGSSTVDFGGVLTNAPGSRTFVIRNIGNLPLGELAVSIGGTHDVEFVAVQPPGTVNGGDSATFTVTFTPAANGERSATLLIASDDESEDPFEIALIGTGSTAQQLLNGYATSAGLSGLDAEPGATPYKDGVPNLLKYAFNMNAAGPDRRTLVPGTGTVGLPVLRIVSGTLRYEYLRRKNSGLTYTPLQSSSLNPNSWQTATGTETATPIDDMWERVVLEQPLLPGGARFFAMRVGIE